MSVSTPARHQKNTLMIEPWAKQLTEQVFGGPPLRIGGRYQHPEHGVITVTRGSYCGNRGVSNFWYWTDADGVEHRGYGARWPEVTDERSE